MKILITQHIPEKGLDILRDNNIDFYIMGKEIPLKQDLINELKKENYVGMISLLTDKIDKEVMNANVNLKIIANYAVGFDNLDLEYAKEKRIIITNTPGVLTETVSEHTVSMIFAAACRIVEADKFTRDGKYIGWGPELLLGYDLKEKILGVLGAGRIGYRVAEIMKNALNMKIIYSDLKESKYMKELGAEYYKDENQVFRDADVITIHLPLTKETKHLINKEKLSFMKKKSILINTARGQIIDEEALYNSLKNKEIFAAALDVFEKEPKIYEGLMGLDNVILLPHIASASVKTRDEMSIIACKNIVEVLNEREPLTKVV